MDPLLTPYFHLGSMNAVLSLTSIEEEQEIALGQIEATPTNFAKIANIGLTCDYCATISYILKKDVERFTAGDKNYIITPGVAKVSARKSIQRVLMNSWFSPSCSEWCTL